MRTVGLIEKAKLVGRKTIPVVVKFDTGATRTSIDKRLAEKAGLVVLASKKTVKTGVGKTKRRLVRGRLVLFNKEFDVIANLSDRSHSKFKVLVGRDVILGNFIIDPSKTHYGPKEGQIKQDIARRLGLG